MKSLSLFPLVLLGALADGVPEGYQPKTLAPRNPALKNPQLLVDLVNDDSQSRWVNLKSDKFTGDIKRTERQFVSVEADRHMQLTSASAYHGTATALGRKWSPQTDDKLFFSMEVQQEEAVNCGGAYVKLFDSSHTSADVAGFDETTPYSIMFGPDRCGYATNKVHFIIKWNKDGDWLEAHLDNAPKTRTSPTAHQYGFMLSKAAGLKVYVDGEVALEGTDLAKLFRATDFATPETVPDENDQKPEDWVDETHIPDPDAVKPADWPEDEPEMIPDEDAVMPDGWLTDEPEFIVNQEAVKPEGWNDAEDGTWLPPRVRNPACAVGCGPWTRPMIANPDYKGEWKAPLVENPEYQGPWAPRMIPNPNFWKIEKPFEVVQPLDAVGIELWTVEAGTAFDNFLITTDENDFHQFIKDTYEYKKDVEAANYKQREDLLEKEGSQEDEEKPAPDSGSWFDNNKTMLLVSLSVPLMTTLFWLRKTFMPSKGSARVAPTPEAEEDAVAEEPKVVKDVGRKASSDGEEVTPDQPASGAETSAPTSAKPAVVAQEEEKSAETKKDD